MLKRWLHKFTGCNFSRHITAHDPVPNVDIEDYYPDLMAFRLAKFGLVQIMLLCDCGRRYDFSLLGAPANDAQVPEEVKAAVRELERMHKLN